MTAPDVPTDSTALTAAASPTEKLIAAWLHGRSPHTQRAYRADVQRFLAGSGVPLDQVALAHVQAFADQLAAAGLAPTSRARALAAVKSLLGFGHRLGVLPVNAGAPLRLPQAKGTLAERILAEADTQRLLALEPHPRNRVLLRLLYASGLRVSELCGLRWRDVQPRGDAGQVTVLGKGSRTRAVLLPAAIWDELLGLRSNHDADMPVFRSRSGGGPLTPMQVLRIVRAAARRAGISAAVSPHWLRHAHASHALDRGAPLHLVAATLGHANVATTGRYLHARPGDSSGRYLAV